MSSFIECKNGIHFYNIYSSEKQRHSPTIFSMTPLFLIQYYCVSICMVLPWCLYTLQAGALKSELSSHTLHIRWLIQWNFGLLMTHPSAYAGPTRFIHSCSFNSPSPYSCLLPRHFYFLYRFLYHSPIP